MVCGKEARYCEIIATSANQIVPPKFHVLPKCCTIFTRPPFPIAVLKGGLGTRLGTERSSCVLYQTGQAPSRQYRATPSVLNILAVYLVSSSGVTHPSLTSKGLAMSLPSLGSAVGSRFTRGSPWNRKGMVSLSVLSTNTKPQTVRFHADIRQARTAVDSTMRFYRYIYNL